jgi:hypothetical protein
MTYRSTGFRVVKFIPWLLALAFVIACGAAAPEDETSPPAEPTQAPAVGETAAPTAVAEPTPESSNEVEQGALSMWGWRKRGPLMATPG